MIRNLYQETATIKDRLLNSMPIDWRNKTTLVSFSNNCKNMVDMVDGPGVGNPMNPT